MSDLPDGWVETNLKEITSILGDGLHGTPKYTENGDFFFINGNNLSGGKIVLDSKTKRVSIEEYNKYKKNIDDRTILVSINGTLGNVAFYNGEKVILGKSACYFNVIDGVNKFFVRYLMSTRYFKIYIQKFASGTTIKNLSLKAMREFPIILPPLSEQKSIANILTAFDKKIALLQAQNQTLETLAQTVFKEWFVDSDNPSIPVSNIIEFNPVEKIDRTREYLFFDMKSLSTTSMAMSEGIFKQSNSGTNFRENDTLFVKITPCLENGKTAFVLDLKGEQIARGSTEFIVMRAKENGSPYLNYCLARNTVFRDYAIKSMIGTSGRQRVPVERIKNFEIKYSFNNIVKFDNTIDPLFTKIKNNSKQINNLTKTRNIMLPQLMSGKVRVKNG